MKETAAKATVVALPTNPSALTVGRAAELFLDSLANPNTIRGYATAVGKTAEKLGEDRPLSTVADDDIGEVLESLWGRAAVGTWNARRAAVGSWLAWCRDRGEAPAVPGWCKRLAAPDSETPVRSWLAIDRLVARREVALREKTLYRMLYETAARAEIHAIARELAQHHRDSGADPPDELPRSRPPRD